MKGFETEFKYEPLGDWVVIEQLPKTESLLVTPAGADDGTLRRGRVLAVGPGRWELGHLVPTKVAVGDVVFLIRMSENDQPFMELPAPEGKDWVMQRDYYLRLREKL